VKPARSDPPDGALQGVPEVTRVGPQIDATVAEPAKDETR
jgi:hypothetical protein